MKELYEYVVNFMLENNITCTESIAQCDRIQELHEQFMCDCFELVEKELPTEVDED